MRIVQTTNLTHHTLACWDWVKTCPVKLTCDICLVKTVCILNLTFPSICIMSNDFDSTASAQLQHSFSYCSYLRVVVRHQPHALPQTFRKSLWLKMSWVHLDTCLFIFAIFPWASHTAAAQCTASCRSRTSALVIVDVKHQNGGNVIYGTMEWFLVSRHSRRRHRVSLLTAKNRNLRLLWAHAQIK